MPKKASTGRWGFCANLKQFSTPYHFPNRTASRHPPNASNARRWAGIQNVAMRYDQESMKFSRSITAEDKLILVSLLVTFGGIILGAILREPRFYGFTAIIVILIVIAGTYMTRSYRLSWLLLFGATAGVLELWADWIHVASLKSLVYTDYFGFKLLESPSYMPVGWWLTCVQFGYIALRLREMWSDAVVVGMISIMGMLLPPWYEEFAKPARAWYYTTSNLLISNTPLWIILTYGGCMFGIAMMALLCYAPNSWGRAIVAGVFTAASFMLSAVFWYTLLA